MIREFVVLTGEVPVALEKLIFIACQARVGHPDRSPQSSSSSDIDQERERARARARLRKNEEDQEFALLLAQFLVRDRLNPLESLLRCDRASGYAAEHVIKLRRHLRARESLVLGIR